MRRLSVSKPGEKGGSATAAVTKELLNHGIHTKGYCYISTCHNEADIDLTIDAARSALETLAIE